ncbi:hypothetical protein CRP01_22975 [Flavilitoribacter nigricans DSM 23189 = NBRC 102662]|uniref:Uncharacterized protein n=1 Tax=Flavilitoribacter nigricans (strain ATCC 23147 / DSM 23189 / NBRC 102662 / NCIMB 1420 / SS-2) TaxID=1122177 RepID=A0A2D0N6D9_FLAN2|nr:hypothetical protein CRP01_22975 [Flavilitoribacter nigricans DSM 23189 = NBRC 102662]
MLIDIGIRSNQPGRPEIRPVFGRLAKFPARFLCEFYFSFRWMIGIEFAGYLNLILNLFLPLNLKI